MTILKKSGAVFALMMAMLLMANEASATHFRYGTITTRVPNPQMRNRVEITVEITWRRSYFTESGLPLPMLGSTVSSSAIGNLTVQAPGGAGAQYALNMVVVSVNAAEDWFVGRSVILHTVANAPAGEHLVRFTNCCRLSTLADRNLDRNYVLEHRFAALAGGVVINNSPVLASFPIRTVGFGVETSFNLPGSDPDGDPLTWRLSTTTESGLVSDRPKLRQPNAGLPLVNDPSFTLTPAGVITWTPARDKCNPSPPLPAGQLPTTCLYAIQVMASDGRGATVPLDFIMEAIIPAGLKPTLKIDGSTAPVNKTFYTGVQSSVVIEAVDFDSAAVELKGTALPQGAFVTPSLPSVKPRIGNNASASAVFTWTPSLGQAGQVIEFAANDQDGNEVTNFLNANIGVADLRYLTGVIRDFTPADPGFNRADGDNAVPIVLADLGADGKPVFNSAAAAQILTVPGGAAAFNNWFNKSPFQVKTFVMSNGGSADPNIFSFVDSNFNNGDQFFTYEAHTYLTYQPGMTLNFSASDDLWVFVNGKLVVDLGGVHTAPRSSVLALDSKAAQLNLQAFGTYRLDIFYAHRGGSHVPSIAMQVPDAVVCSALGAPVPVTTPTLLGTAIAVGAITRLSTANGLASSGAAWTVDQHEVAPGFKVEFDFKIAPAAPNGGEGFAFVIQASGPTALGGDGSNLGYGGLARSLAIEFDTHFDAPQGDPVFGEHVSVHFNSSNPAGQNSASEVFSIGASNPATGGPVDFNDNQPHHVRIQYQPPPVDVTLPPGSPRYGFIRVWLDDALNPIASVQIDANRLAAAFASGFGYFGFTTGATGTTTATVEVSNLKIGKLLTSGATSHLTSLPATMLPDTLGSVVLQLRDICNAKVAGGGQAASIAATLTTDGYTTPVTIVDQLDGTYRLSYTPRVGGAWQLSVLVDDVPILNNPAALLVMPATPTLSVTAGTFPYNGSPRSAAGTATGVFNEPLGALTFTYNGQPAAVDAGSYDAVGSYAGNSHYAAATAPAATLTITRIAPTVTVNDTTVIYNGQPQAATGSVTGIGGAVIGSPAFTYAPNDPPVDAGAYAVTGSFAGNTNYTEASGAGTLTIGAATPTVTVVDVSATYDGTPHPATAAVSGVNGEAAGVATLTYDGDPTAPINAGAYVVAASAAANGNYAAASGSGVVVIAKATPIVEVISSTTTYDAAPHGVVAVVKGVNGVVLGAPDAITYDGSPALPVNAGDYDVVASVLESQNYVATSGAGVLTIGPATPSVAVNNASFVYDGTAHGATGTVTGVANESLGPLSFTYDGDSAAPIDAKTYQVIASFAGSNNYVAASGAGTLAITPATPTVVVNSASFVYDGQPHTVTGNVIGIGEDQPGPLTFTYDGDPSAPVNAKSYHVVASFAAGGNYGAATGEGTLDITRASATVTVTGGTFTYDGQTHSAGVAVTGVNGVDLGAPSSVTYNGSAASPRDAASYAVVASFDATANYNEASGGATIVINKAPLAITADDKTMAERTAVPALTATYSGFVNGETPSVLDAPVTLLTTATSTSAPGGYPILASGASDVNYDISFTPGVLTILPITPGSMRGSGFVRDDFNKYDFDFFAKENATGADRGKLELRIKDEDRKGQRGKKPRNDRFVSRLLTNVVFSDDPSSQPGKSPKVQMDTVLFAGTGEWNGKAGYRFEAFAQDLGEPGRHRESIRVTVLDAAGNIVAHVEGDLDGGNIQSARIKH